LPLVKDSLLELLSADNFPCNDTSHFVCVCVVTNSVRHTGDFRTEALNEIEKVGAGVKFGSLAFAE